MININPRNGETVQNILDSIFKLYKDYLNEAQKKQILDEAYDIFKRKVKFNSSSIEEMLEKIQEQRKFYYFDFFLHILFQQIHNQEIFTPRFSNLFEAYFDGELMRLTHKDDIYDINACYQLILDRSMNFNLCKQFIPDMSQQSQIREQQIMTKNLSKFLIPILDINDKYRYNILVPYFPMGTLSAFIDSKQDQHSKNQIELSIIDKIIILLEIATAMKDLHFYGQVHGNLTDDNIFLSSTKDAYIGSICHDRIIEEQRTRLEKAFYTRSPESHFNHHDETINNLDYNKTKSCDIFSFGVIMYEMLSEKSVRLKFRERNFTLSQIINILKNNYFDFLFLDENGELFNNELMIDYKNIIGKCMKNDVNERYSSFIEITDSIKKSRIYIENKEEIDFRIHNAIDSNDYECKFSDIIESYFRGKENCKKDILSLVDELNVFHIDKDYYTNFDENCDLIKALVYVLNLQVKNND